MLLESDASAAPKADSLFAGEAVLISGADSTTMPGTAVLSMAEAFEGSDIALLSVLLTVAMPAAVLDRMMNVMTTLALLI